MASPFFFPTSAPAYAHPTSAAAATYPPPPFPGGYYTSPFPFFYNPRAFPYLPSASVYAPATGFSPTTASLFDSPSQYQYHPPWAPPPLASPPAPPPLQRTAPPVPAPLPKIHNTSGASINGVHKHTGPQILSKISQEAHARAPAFPYADPPSPNGGGGGRGIRVECCYIFKCRLEDYAQKAGIRSPVYQTTVEILTEGPPREKAFQSTVLINNAKYESLPGFSSRKAAEQSAAEVALMEIGKSVSIPALQDTGLCKNLLQDYAHKMNYGYPSYIWDKQTSGVGPSICTVEIGGIKYIGAAARTKKEAQIKAAQTALLAIQGQSEGCANGTTKYIVVPEKMQGQETEKKPNETPTSLKAKKGGFKKQWNKQKFITKNGQAVNVEKDEAVAGDTLQSDVPMEPLETAHGPSIDTIVLQPDEGAGRVEHEPTSDSVVLQPDVEARKVKQESPSDTAMPQAYEDAGRVEQEPPSGTPMVLHNEEARSVKQEPFNDTAMPQPHVEDISVEPEPPRDTAVVQPNEELRSLKEEPHIDTAVPQPNEVAKTSVAHASLSDSTIEQPNSEARSLNEEPLSNAAITQHDKETRTVNQEPPINGSLLQPKVEYSESPSDSTIEQPNSEARSINEEPLSNAAITQHDEETRTVNQEPPINGSLLQPKIEYSEYVLEHSGQIMGDMLLLPFDLQLVQSAPCLHELLENMYA